MGNALPTLGDKTFDVYLNGKAFWRNVPAAIWNYRLGGYQVLKKWLSYRERDILGRPLGPEEVQYFSEYRATDWSNSATHRICVCKSGKAHGVMTLIR